MKRFFCLFVLALPACKGIAQTIVINEVVYSNKTVLFDCNGDSPDWFELYNPGDNPVNLQHYKITDDTSKTGYWVFPEYIMKPKEYLIVFASGKGKIDNSGFHTDFRLANMKESLFLFNQDDEVIDLIQAVCVPTDCSISRKPDGSGSLSIVRPTPGGSNNNAEDITVNFIPDKLTINFESGFYNSPVSITLSNEDPGNKIVYTLDGSIPDEESVEFDQAVYLEDLTPAEMRFADETDAGTKPGNKIFKANILRAVVYSSGCPASNEICNTYFINESIKDYYEVPVVSIITEKDNLFDDEIGIYVTGNHINYEQHGRKWERLAHIEIFDSQGDQIINQDAGIRIHGRGSRKNPQKSFRLCADNEYGSEYFAYPFFSQKPELDRFKTLVMRTTSGVTGSNTVSLIKDELCHYLVDNMDIDYLASQPAVAFVNGEYWGIYNLMELQDKYYIENNYKVTDPDIDIIAFDRRITVEEGTIDAYNELIAYLRAADPSTPGFYDELSSKIAINGLIDYFIAQFYLANTDWPVSNLDLWRFDAENEQWRFFFFDSDASMVWLNFDQITDYSNNIENYQKYPEFSTFLLRSLLNNNEFRKEFIRKYYYHLNMTFNASRVIDEINHFEKIYAPLVPDHIYRWHDPVDYIKWTENVDWLKKFAIQRPFVVTEQLQKNFGNPFTIFPNPSQGDFNVELYGQSESAVIKVFSIKGELLNQWLVSQGQNNIIEINTDLLPGIYLLQVVAYNMAFVSKLIIQ